MANPAGDIFNLKNIIYFQTRRQENMISCVIE